MSHLFKAQAFCRSVAGSCPKISLGTAAALFLTACGGGSSPSINCAFIALGQVTSKLSVSAVAGASLTIAPFSLIAPSGCSAVYTSSPLPKSLAINSSSSEITGSVATPGTYGWTVTLTVSPNGGQLDRPVELSVTK